MHVLSWKINAIITETAHSIFFIFVSKFTNSFGNMGQDITPVSNLWNAVLLLHLTALFIVCVSCYYSLHCASNIIHYYRLLNKISHFKKL